jgi:hypothetical protein
MISKAQQPLYVVPSGCYQGFGIDLLQGSHPEPAHPVPELALRKQLLYPHLAFPYRLLVELGLHVCSDSAFHSCCAGVR